MQRRMFSRINSSVFLASALFLLLLVAACTNVQTQGKLAPQSGLERQDGVVTEKIEESAVTPPAPQAPAAQSYEITRETLAKLNASFTIATPLALSETARKMKSGDVYVFAGGITNTDSFL